MRRAYSRRTVLGGIGAVTAAGVLAGCSGGGGDGGDGGDGGGGPPTVDAPSEVADYVGDSDNFDGSMVDLTGESEATVDVGAEGNDGNFAFDPPAIKVSTGTTVTWEWTGKGSSHNVVAEEGAFDSGTAVSEEGTTFTHTFDSAGTFLYYCGPHKTLGMKGAVVVEG